MVLNILKVLLPVFRIPTRHEEKWIMENARSADVETVGYRPDLYDNWWKKRDDADQPTTRELTEVDKETLLLIQQEEGDLESHAGSWRSSSQDRNTSLQTKVLESLREVKSTSSLWSRSPPDLEGVIRKLVRERSTDARFTHFTSSLLQARVSDPEVRESDEYSIVKLLHDIAMSYSGQIDRVLYHAPSTENQPPEEPTSTLDSNSTLSETSVSTKPFSFSSPGSALDTPQKSVSEDMVFNKSDQMVDSEISRVHLDIDYTTFKSVSSLNTREDSI